MTTDRDGPSESAGDDEALPPPRERTHPLVSSLCTGLDDDESAEQCGVALALIADSQPRKASHIVGRLVELVVANPESAATIRTLATLRDQHGREIRGALMTETGYSDARQLYSLVEYADPWDLSSHDTEIPDGEESDLSFISAVMRLVELEEEGRDPLDSDVWTRFIQQMPGEGGESASQEEIELAAAREDSRPRSVRRRHRRIERIANSRLFRVIESSSRFDELEVLSGLRSHRFGKTIRTRGRVGTEEHALTLLLVHQVDSAAFRRLLTDRLRGWNRLTGDGVATVVDSGDSPRPWVATDVVGGSLADRDRLSHREALVHARILSRALVTVHQHGTVHAGIDPLSVSYPPTGLDSAAKPMLDMIGLVSVYRQFADIDTLVDIRYAAPEQFDEQSIDGATDIYQLGAVLYRALTGHPPYDGDVETVRERIHAGEFVPPTERNPDLPEAVDDIIAKAMATQKLLRYDNATRFHQEIRQLCDDVR